MPASALGLTLGIPAGILLQNTMAVRKIAISVPQEVLKDVDLLAKKAGTTRSGFITGVLVEVSRAKGQREITRRIDRLFEEAELQKEQAETSRAFLKAAEPSFEDSDW